MTTSSAEARPGAIALVRAFYDARARGDLEAVRSLLADDVTWHEPDVGNPHTGGIHGAGAVVGMITEAQRLTGGTFSPGRHLLGVRSPGRPRRGGPQ